MGIYRSNCHEAKIHLTSLKGKICFICEECRKPCKVKEKIDSSLNFERKGRMKRLFSFVSKILDLFSRISDLSWIIIVLILFFTIFIIVLMGVIKR